jgi:hypothetical protein
MGKVRRRSCGRREVRRSSSSHALRRARSLLQGRPLLMRVALRVVTWNRNWRWYPISPHSAPVRRSQLRTQPVTDLPRLAHPVRYLSLPVRRRERCTIVAVAQSRPCAATRTSIVLSVLEVLPRWHSRHPDDRVHRREGSERRATTLLSRARSGSRPVVGVSRGWRRGVLGRRRSKVRGGRVGLERGVEVERAGGWVGEECGEEMRRGLGSRVAGRTCISRR